MNTRPTLNPCIVSGCTTLTRKITGLCQLHNDRAYHVHRRALGGLPPADLVVLAVWPSSLNKRFALTNAPDGLEGWALFDRQLGSVVADDGGPIVHTTAAAALEAMEAAEAKATGLSSDPDPEPAADDGDGEPRSAGDDGGPMAIEGETFDYVLGIDHGSSPAVAWLSSPARPATDVWTLRAPAMKVLHEDCAPDEHPVDWRQNALDSLGAAVGLADGYGPMVVAETVLAELDRRAANVTRLQVEHARASALCAGVPATRVVYEDGQVKEEPLTLTERVRHLADKCAGAWRVLNEVSALFDAVELDGELGIKGRVSKVLKERAAQDKEIARLRGLVESQAEERAAQDKEIARLRGLVESQADQLTVLMNAPYALTREELRQRCEDYARGERLVERALAPKEVTRGR